jgi:hypothetical protein
MRLYHTGAAKVSWSSLYPAGIPLGVGDTLVFALPLPTPAL